MEDVIADVRRHAEAAGMTVYPGFPEGSSLARWADDDVAAFVQLGAEVASAPLLYVAALTAAQIADVDGVAVEDTGYRPDETVTVLAGWVAGPVLHTLTVTDPDWEQALDSAVEDADVAMFRDQIDRQEREEQAQAYARQVVSDPVFHDHGSQGRDAKKLAVVQRLLPELDEQMAWRVVRHADRIDRAELQGPREAGWAEQARALMAAGMPKRRAAEELGISVNVLNRILQTNPPGR